MPAKKLLILGGTSEAANLARTLVAQLGDKLDITVSYAGVTGHQPDLPCDVRVGGFGGASGLIAYLEDEKVDFLVDATHPFADRISQHAYVAAQALELPVLVLTRLPWLETVKDRWIEVNNMKEAAETVADLNRATFLTIGIKELSHFEGLGDIPLAVRLLKQPEAGLALDNYLVVEGRPPFDLEAEKKLIRDQSIRVLVSKNSGGKITANKILAAREEGCVVVMVNRPPLEPLEHVVEIGAVVDWLRTFNL